MNIKSMVVKVKEMVFGPTYPELEALNIKVSKKLIEFNSDDKGYLKELKKEYNLIIAYMKKNQNVDFFQNRVLALSDDEDVSVEFGEGYHALDWASIYDDYFVNSEGEVKQSPFDEYNYMIDTRGDDVWSL